MAGRSEISQTLKFKGMRNCQESKKLSSSVDRFKKEYEKKLRELSVQQSVLLESQKRRESRRRSLPSTVDSKSEDEMRSVAEKILQRSSLSDSALDQYAKGLRSGLKGENKSPLLTSPLLKLPSITIQKDAGTGKIELEDVTSIKTPKNKLKYSKQAQARLDIQDLTTKLSNGYSASIIASPPMTRPARRGSLQVTNLFSSAVEEAVSNRRVLMRRGSCPDLSLNLWAKDKKFIGGNCSGTFENQNFTRQVEEMKRCRYLRFPTSIREDDEEMNRVLQKNDHLSSEYGNWERCNDFGGNRV